MEEIDLKEILLIIWRRKIAVIIVMAISIIVGLIYTYNYTTPLYNSTATIILGKVSSTITGENLDKNSTITESDLSLNSNLILTYSELVKSRTIMEKVKSTLKINESVEKLSSSVLVDRVNDSDLLSITVSNANPKIARDIVNELVVMFSEQVKEIYKIDNVYIVDSPTIATDSYNINHVKDVMIFSIVGLFLSSAYIVIYTFIDNTVKSTADLENLLKIKTLITIPFDKKKKEELITLNDGKSIISEAFRTLRTNVQFSSVDKKGAQTLLITSCLPGEGKSYVSANLSVAFAQTGKKVVLVDSDMRRGRQSKIFDIPNKNGLSNYISNIDANGMEVNWNLGEYIKKTKIENLDLITAGSVPPNPAELLASNRLLELIETLEKYYDLIIFDGAPILPVTDSLLLGRVLSKTMLVAVHNKTKKENLVKAKASIEDVGGKIIGITLNKFSTTGSDTDSYYYYSETQPKINIKLRLEKAYEDVKDYFKNMIKKVKSIKKRLNSAKTEEEIEAEKIFVTELNKKREFDRIQKESEKIRREEEKKVAMQEKAKRDLELARKREIEKIRKEEMKKIIAEEKERQAKFEAEERAREDAIMAEEKAKRDEEEAKIREEQEKVKLEMKQKKAEENAVKQKENAQKRAKQKEEFIKKMNEAKAKAIVKKDEWSEKIKVKKEEYSKKYAEYKVKKAEENKQKAIEKEKRDAELAKIREAEKIKRDAERKIQMEEKAKKDAELAKIREEERIRKAEENKQKAIEKEKRDAELAKIREEEKARKAEEKRIQMEEKAKKDAELARLREEERIKKEEEKQRREAELKYSDEYLQENLYPKTKYNKF